MPTIDPTAKMDPKAELADDVVIGPSCVIEGQVVIGAGTKLFGHAYLRGPLTLGADNAVYPFVTLGLAPQDRKFDAEHDGAGVVIGDRNVIREGVSIHRATSDKPTTLGDDNYLMAQSHLGHDVKLGDHCMLANCAVVGGHAVIGDHVMLGGYAGVHQFCRVGRLAMLSGHSGMGKDLPPFCTSYVMRTVGSLNLVGLRRAGYRDHVKSLQRAFDLLFRSQHANQQALALIEQDFGADPLCMELVEFVRTSKRGLLAYQAGSK